MTGYFRLPVIPTVLGFNPRLQFLHEQDALDVLEHATASDVTGTFNVAGDGIITLAQAVRRIGRPSLPLPGFAVPDASARRSGRPGVADFSPEQVAFLTYGRGLDTTRMRTMLGFEPSFTTAQAFADFASVAHPRAVLPGPGAGHRVGPRRRADLRRRRAPWVTPRSSRSGRAASLGAAPVRTSRPRTAAAWRPRRRAVRQPPRDRRRGKTPVHRPDTRAEPA